MNHILASIITDFFQVQYCNIAKTEAGDVSNDITFYIQI